MALNRTRMPIPPWRIRVNFSERLRKAPEWEAAPAGDCNSAARKLRSYEITQSSDYTAVASRCCLPLWRFAPKSVSVGTLALRTEIGLSRHKIPVTVDSPAPWRETRRRRVCPTLRRRTAFPVQSNRISNRWACILGEHVSARVSVPFPGCLIAHVRRAASATPPPYKTIQEYSFPGGELNALRADIRSQSEACTPNLDSPFVVHGRKN